MSESDKILLEKAKNGDVEAFERLIGGYQKKVFNIALRMMGNHDDASELAQEAFIKVYRSIKTFKGECQFSTWIYRVTTNVCLDELRKRKNARVVSIDEDIHGEDGDMQRQIEDGGPTPDMLAERSEMKRVLNKMINSLPPEQRLVIVLRDVQGFSYDEIAVMLKCPEGTVKSRINRARSALRELIRSKSELFSEDYVK